VGWRGDEKKARQFAIADPSRALGLLDDAVIPKAVEAHLIDSVHKIALYTFRAELLDRLGRADDAEVTRSRVRDEYATFIEAHDQAVEDAKGKDPNTIQSALQGKARLLEALGDQLEADRTRLLAADVCETGRGESGRRAELASAPFFLAGQGVMGFESSAAFRRGWESSLRAVEMAFRDELLEAGRAVAIAYCAKCGAVVPANYKKKKCSSGHKVGEVRVVVNADEADERAALEREGVGKSLGTDWVAE
jgi:hypothetical protein